MIIKEVYLDDIIKNLGASLKKVEGYNANLKISNIVDSVRVNESSLDWINPSKLDKQKIAEDSKARVILVDSTVKYSDALKEKGKVLLKVSNPKKSLIKIIKTFFYPTIKSGIHETSYIHPNAKIGKNVYIGPNCYIGDCIIGNNNVIHSGVNIYDRTIIGNNNTIHSGAVLCVDGLGCVRAKDGKLEEFPQIGGVIIGDNCYIGANTHIASGSLSDTVIGNGCKINGMCFIGSNDILHENVWITGSSMLAGSVEVGKNVNIFSGVVVRDWCKIGDDATIGMGAVVTKDVPSGETWVGNPARKLIKKI